ncbi:MAG: hypothetical protein CMJ36_00340 [Phycisphaerae bacterium]|nr:hypothetical protein [Phycisphaerae bacterium]
MRYLVSHVVRIGSFVLLGVLVNLLDFKSDLGMGVWISGIILIVLVWWFGVVRARLQNMGFAPWMCWMYACIGPFIPIPYIRLLPWATGFFVPTGMFEDIDD